MEEIFMEDKSSEEPGQYDEIEKATKKGHVRTTRGPEKKSHGISTKSMKKRINALRLGSEFDEDFNFSPRLSVGGFDIAIGSYEVSSDDENSDLGLFQDIVELELTQAPVLIPGLSYQEIPGDDHCLFNAIGIHLGLEEQDIRNIAADALEPYALEHPEIVSGLLKNGETLEEYTDGIRASEWGDNLEIAVIMPLIGRAVLVVNPDGRIDNLDAIEKYPEEPPIFVCYNGHNHYDAYLSQDNNLTNEYISEYKKQLAERALMSEQDSDADIEAVHELVQDKMVDFNSEGEISEQSEEQKGIKVFSNHHHVKATVSAATGQLSISVSPLRPSTYLGKRQGAHITAYTVFVTAILDTVDDQNIEDIPNLLIEIAKQFIPQEQLKTLQTAVFELMKHKPEHFEKQTRKNLTRHLRNDNDEPTVQMIKKALKVEKANFLANLVDELSNQILQGINKNTNTLYLRPIKKTKKELGEEGAKIKAAMQSLKAIHRLGGYFLEGNQVERDKILKNIKASPEGLKRFVGDDISPGNIDTFIQKQNQPTEQKRTLCTTSDLMFELFDFNYYEYKAALILQNLPKEFSKINQEFSKSLAQHGAEQAIKDFPNLISSLKNPEQKKMKKILQSVDTLISDNSPNIVKQHLKLIMQHAFPRLSRLPIEDQQVVFQRFFERMQTEMKWSDIDLNGIIEGCQESFPALDSMQRSNFSL